jgi:ubiquinone biosynthesis accessory factor UbiJ
MFAAFGLNASEYVVEEAELMARGVDVARFNREVDTLADDAARLDARLRQLEARPLSEDAPSRPA